MMRFIFYFILLILFVWLGILIHRDPGYVLITYQHWSLETTLWFALIAILLFYLVLFILLRLFRGTVIFPEKWRIWSRKRHRQKAEQYTYRGLCDLAEGDWKTAEHNLVKGADENTTPLINYLAAAQAAQQQGKFEERDNYLRLAHQSAPQAEIATGLTQAQLQFNARQWELALATLRHLNQIDPKHVYVLKLLKNTYVKLQDWKSLQTLLPELKKYKVLSTDELTQLEQLTYAELLRTAIDANNDQWINTLWQELPRNLQTDPALVNLYVEYLQKTNEINKAEILIREALKKNWHPILVNSYGKLKTDTPDKQLTTAEIWLRTHTNDPALLLTLGRLCIANRLWGKAKEYLAASLKLQPKAETYLELGRLHEQLNEPQEAMNCYRKGLNIY